jgi:hypothetical protein
MQEAMVFQGEYLLRARFYRNQQTDIIRRHSPEMTHLQIESQACRDRRRDLAAKERQRQDVQTEREYYLGLVKSHKSIL